MREKLINSIKYLIFGFLAILLLALAVKNQNPKELFQSLASLEMKWIYLSIMLGALAIIVRGIRWVHMIRPLGYKCKISNSINAVAIGYLTNLAIPRAGEISRCTTLKIKENIPVDKLFGTVIAERAIDLLAIISLLLVMFIFKLEKINIFFNDVFSKFQTFFFEIFDSFLHSDKLIVLFVFILLAILSVFFVYIMKKQSSTFIIKIKAFFTGIKEGFISVKRIKNKTAFWIHTGLIWSLYALMTYICFFAIGETNSLIFIDGVYIMVIGGIGMIVPTPAGFGSYHLATKLGLMSLGIGADSALIFAFAVHTAQTLMALFFGAISLALLFISKNNAKDAINQ